MQAQISEYKSTSMTWWVLKNLGLLILLFNAFYAASQGGLYGNSAVLVLAQLVMLTGALTSIVHYFALKHANPNISKPEGLVSEFGLFRLVRHPMYFGDSLLCVGLILMVPSLISVFLALFISLAVWRLCIAEDFAMQSRFGPDFERWFQKTKRLIPLVF